MLVTKREIRWKRNNDVITFPALKLLCTRPKRAMNTVASIMSYWMQKY